MQLKSFVVVIIMATGIVTVNSSISIDMREAMVKTGIVPNVFENPPPKCLEVIYPEGGAVKAGNTLTPTIVKDIPKVIWKADDNQFYTLIMIDPDAPYPDSPQYAEIRHWIVVNIPGTNIEDGETLFEYVGAGPPKGSPPHRYILLVYRQQGNQEFNEPKVSMYSYDHRRGFSTRKFAKRNHLGDPIAGNFFYAQWDEYVPILREQYGNP